MVDAWRSPEGYQPLLSAGRQALAWEVLRRDPAYAAAASAAATLLPAAAAAAFAARWGVHFR